MEILLREYSADKGEKIVLEPEPRKRIFPENRLLHTNFTTLVGNENLLGLLCKINRKFKNQEGS